MIFPWYLRWILAPFALLYGLGVSFRDALYSNGVLRSAKFDLPILSLGNLSMGGAGKTPHTEYLIRLLQPYLLVAVLSRGYKRKTRGFRFVQNRDNANSVGDEPMQYKSKFPKVPVAVAELRALAIPEILKFQPETQVIILDDAFQHRAVAPWGNILLTEYNYPFFKDQLLPMGRLREWKTGVRRADAVVVTKCPQDLDTVSVDKFTAAIHNYHPKVPVFFSAYEYGQPYSLYFPEIKKEIEKDMAVVVVSGLARSEYLLDKIHQLSNEVYALEYPDHYYFTDYDMAMIKRRYDTIQNPKKIILTTEKDASRLLLHKNLLESEGLPIAVLPVTVKFLELSSINFDTWIKNRLLEFKV